MQDTFIVYAKRTPLGKIGGILSNVRPDDMMAHLFKDLKSNISFDLNEIDDVIVGCANQAGEDNRNVARMASVLAGLPYEVPAVTLNRLCASSLDATIDAWSRIRSGLADCIVVGGVESMTRAPLVMSKASSAYGRDQKMYDSSFGWRFPNKKMEAMFPLMSMGQTAEEVVDKHNISRQEQDQFALSSHQKAVEAQTKNLFDDEIVSLSVFKSKKETIEVSKDEGPRANTSIEKLASLRPVFRENGTITAGNASSMNDGAACLLVVSEKFMKKNNLTPMARISGAGIRGIHPNIMGLGPVEATKRLCQKFGKKITDFDVMELNEAFAAQVLGCVKELDLDLNKVNLRGGAISLGHPLGCSGARILTTLLHIMKTENNLKNGLATMCVGVGQGVALSVEKA
ncbi:MAG: thiolase family protein [Bacteriovoracaceae bacterium]